MRHPQTFHELIRRTLSSAHKICERELSTRDMSVREFRRNPRGHRIRHRFPVPGGMSVSEIMVENITQNNALWLHLKLTAEYGPVIYR